MMCFIDFERSLADEFRALEAVASKRRSLSLLGRIAPARSAVSCPMSRHVQADLVGIVRIVHGKRMRGAAVQTIRENETGALGSHMTHSNDSSQVLLLPQKAVHAEFLPALAPSPPSPPCDRPHSSPSSLTPRHNQKTSPCAPARTAPPSLQTIPRWFRSP